MLKRLLCLHLLPVNVNIEKMIQVLFEIEANKSSKILSIDTYYKDLSHATVTWSSANTSISGSLINYQSKQKGFNLLVF